MPVIKMLLPQFGMGMQEAEIGAWHKKVGDRVAAGEVLVEAEAEKSTIEIPSPANGELVEILANTGETVKVRAVIAHIKTD
jgi:pyruvate/2-oxoglutarate dehydrogenase complex dihydrolipoamide acyltransferase (E2) component